MPEPLPLLWLCGPSGVGKSSVGYEVFRILYSSGLKCGYVDLDQIGFARPAPVADPDNHQLKARNLSLLCSSFRAEHVQRMVISGIVNSPEVVDLHRHAVPDARMTVYRLTVSPSELRHRIFRRGAGAGPSLVGDALAGRSRDGLIKAADDSVAEAEEMQRLDIGDLTIATDNLTVGEVALQALRTWMS